MTDEERAKLAAEQAAKKTPKEVTEKEKKEDKVKPVRSGVHGKKRR